ncbi:hypothetical protein GCM10009530_63230 [Microbispora corallina]|uniref:Uncharacterized protein n=1 Tax=Microbispora corallina TaxID=83302 RepID=A0ABQ4GBM8_9ACTN|nr:hypothetical protein [Microbispora corallina]GIH44447.1 hypothetical protein Mco01_74470 [Microbispora corallina]
MSRRIIPNALGSPAGRETTVGWDAPLNTFFAMAFDPPASGDLDDDEVEVFWVGTAPGEIPTVQRLAKALAQHGVELPMLVAQRLSEDCAGEGDQSQGRPGSALIASMTQSGGPR